MTESQGRLVVIRLGERRLALDLASVAEVTELPVTWPIPLAPASFRGVMNSHGTLVPLLDLALYLGFGSGIADGKALVLDRQVGELALWVDEVERIIPSAEAVHKQTMDDAVLEEVLAIGGSEVLLLQAGLLVAALEADLQGVVHVSHPWQEDVA